MRFTRNPTLSVAVIAAAVLASAVQIAEAAPIIPVRNASFEEFGLPEGFFSVPKTVGAANEVVSADPVPGWRLSGVEGGVTGGSFRPERSKLTMVPDGVNTAFTNGAFISQVVGAVLEVNTRYVLSVDVGRRTDAPFPGYRVQLFAGGVLLAEDDSRLVPERGAFETSRVGYTARRGDPNLGGALEIRLTSRGGQTNFDNVVLTPEPSTALLLAGGLATLAARRRQSRTGNGQRLRA